MSHTHSEELASFPHPESQLELFKSPLTPDAQSTGVDSIVPEHRVARMGDEEFSFFKAELKRGSVFTSNHCEAKDLGKHFLAIGMGYFKLWEPEALAQIGLIYNYIDQALPDTQNGKGVYPVFMTCKILHKDDLELIERNPI